MRQIKNAYLAQLLLQSRFTPAKQRRSQLDAAEELLALAQKDGRREYPLEFIWFKITGHRPKAELPHEPVKAADLADDLRVYIWKLSGRVAEPTALQEQKVYTTQTLAVELGLATKTIDRWRRRGLAARKFIFDDGKKRIGFLKSAVDQFVRGNPRLLEKARNFTRLSNEEKEHIIKRATALSAKTDMKTFGIIKTIAAETGRGKETVRTILAAYAAKHPEKARALRRPPAAITAAEASELYRLHCQGTSVTELCARFHRSRSAVYRLIMQRRAKAVMARHIEYVPSGEFLSPRAEKEILSQPLPTRMLSFAGARLPTRVRGSLTEYLDSLKSIQALTREHEADLFRRYNYLKYAATRIQEQIRQTRRRGELVNKAEGLLGAAESVKNTLIEANLRLVVSIATKHAGGGANLLDLISEGNMSLMNAVEKFDYTKGFRFATYAGLVIMKDFARKIPADQACRDHGAASLPQSQHTLAAETPPDIAEVERARHNLMQVIKDNLDEREQHTIINHFGLTGTVVRKNKKTLQEIGDDLGLTKERVRQIELSALQKLRQTLSAEEFDLLIG